MQIATVQQQKMAMLAIIQQLAAQGIDLPSVAEGAKLRVFASVELHELPAEFRLRTAAAVDELVREALGNDEESTDE